MGPERARCSGLHAEKHLSAAAADSVATILDGKSPVYWANWLDNASHTPDYAYTKTWHYKNIDAGVKYQDAPLNPKGDVVTAIREQIAILRSPKSTKEQKALALKILIHTTGDMHQPMHMGHLSDLGGNEMAATLLRPRHQPTLNMGQQPDEQRPRVDIHRVAAATRPPLARTGSG